MAVLHVNLGHEEEPRQGLRIGSARTKHGTWRAKHGAPKAHRAALPSRIASPKAAGARAPHLRGERDPECVVPEGALGH